LDKKPLISIVTPSYNQGKFIEDTLLSVKNQKYTNIEHIVVDGGSTDKTLDILEKNEGKYNLKWISEPDKGQSDAINKGFERVNGEIIGWINSDDLYFDKEVFTDVVRSFSKWEEVDVIYGDHVVIDEKNLIKRVRYTIPWFNHGRLLIHDFINQPSTFFKREVIDRCRLDVNIDLPMDYEFWLKISKNGINFRHCNRIISCHRRYRSAKTQARWNEMIEATKKLQQRYGQTFGLKYHIWSFLDKSIMAYMRIKGLFELVRIYSNREKYHFTFEPRFDSILKTTTRQLLYPTIDF